MKNTCIVIANAEKALFYNEVEKQKKPVNLRQNPSFASAKAGTRFSMTKMLKHPASRLKEKDLVSDRPGRYKSSGSARGAFVDRANHHTQEHTKFATKIADFLKKNEGSYGQIIICSEPNFLGKLKAQLTDSVSELVEHYIDKNLVPEFETKNAEEQINFSELKGFKKFVL
jgi:protein required for attachment to host cells